jgi:hypothetical protein
MTIACVRKIVGEPMRAIPFPAAIVERFTVASDATAQP